MKKHLMLSAISLSLISLLAGCNKDDFSLTDHELKIDRYSRYTLTTNKEGGNYTWSSSDTNIATVDSNGVVDMCGNIGNVTITCSNGRKTDSCEITAVNKSKSGHFEIEDQTAFVGVDYVPTVYVVYSNQDFLITNFTLTSNDTSVASIINSNTIRGVSVGETTVSVEANWKGKDIVSKSFTINIKNPNDILLDETTYDIYSVDDTSTVKNNKVTVTGTSFREGKTIDDSLVISLEDNDYLKAEGNVVSFKKHYDSSNVSIISGTASSTVLTGVSVPFSINVHPNFELKDPEEEIKSSSDNAFSTIELSKGSFEGKSDVLKYVIPDVPANQNASNKTWSAWSARVEFSETTNKNGNNAYSDLMNKGYSLLGFDMLYKGTKGVYIGCYNYNDYYYVNCQINNPNVLIVNSDNKVTNTLVANEWFSVYIKLDEMLSENAGRGASSSSVFINPCFVSDEVYLTNIKYYYDRASIEDLEVIYDNADRTIVEDVDNPNKGNVLTNEFKAFSPSYVSLTKNGEKYLYDSTNAEAMDRELRSKVFPVNVNNGNATGNGYRYFAFNYKYIEGQPTMYVYDLFKKANVSFKLIPNIEINDSNVFIFKDGKQVNKISSNEEMTIVVKIDGKGADSMYITSNSITKFEFCNFAYFKDASFRDDFGFDEPLSSIVFNLDFAFIGESFLVNELIDVFYKQARVSNFEINSVSFDNPIATYDAQNKSITLNGEGNAIATIEISYNNYTVTSYLKICSNKESCISFIDHSAEIYCGNLDLPNKSYSPQLKVFKNKQRILNLDSINLDVVSGNDLINIEGTTIIGLKEGIATIKASFNLGGNEYADTMEIKVYNERIDTGLTQVKTDAASLEYITEPAFGVNSYYKLTSERASWNDEIDISMVAHTDTVKAVENMNTYGIKYFIFNMYCYDNTYFRVYSADAGVHTGDGVTVSYSINPLANSKIAFYKNGVSVSSIMPKTWYTVVVDYSDFIDTYKSGYTCVQITNMKGTAFFSNIRCYNSSNFIDDYLDELAIGYLDEVESPFTAFKNGVPDLTSNFTMSSSDLISFANNKITGIKAGMGVVTFTNSEFNFSKTIPVNVKSAMETHGPDELIVTTVTHNFTYEPYASTIGGKTGVYKYTGANGCNYLDTLEIKETSHKTGNTGAAANVPIFDNAAKAVKNLTDKGIKYFSVNMFVTDNTSFRIWAMKKTMGGNGNIAIATDGTITDGIDGVVKFYKEDGTALTSVPHNEWINVVIDYSFLTPAANQYVYVQFSNGVGTYYISEVNYFTGNYEGYLNINK